MAVLVKTSNVSSATAATLPRLALHRKIRKLICELSTSSESTHFELLNATFLLKAQVIDSKVILTQSVALETSQILAGIWHTSYTPIFLLREVIKYGNRSETLDFQLD